MESENVMVDPPLTPCLCHPGVGAGHWTLTWRPFLDKIRDRPPPLALDWLGPLPKMNLNAMAGDEVSIRNELTA